MLKILKCSVQDSTVQHDVDRDVIHCTCSLWPTLLCANVMALLVPYKAELVLEASHIGGPHAHTINEGNNSMLSLTRTQKFCFPRCRWVSLVQGPAAVCMGLFLNPFNPL